ncbi:MAG: sigma-54-dependent Fis family transcriptional regulator [Planctomycetes bacterium]|nr:sigma-54-dependent Fis family transcriptional regulator [Planctomycetota bacterium]
MPWKILVLATDRAVAHQYQHMLAADRRDVRSLIVGDAEIAPHELSVVDVVFAILTASDASPVPILCQLKAAGNTAPVVVVSRNLAVETAVEAMREGAADYLREPCTIDALRAALTRLAPTPDALASAAAHHDPPGTERFEGMIGQCLAMREVFALIERIAPADATVLITGESGTGKEMVARAIHQLSRRRDNPYLGCDCTALAPTLLESELFGHVKGSFSGAVATKSGLFEAAHHGTLLLDEVSNLSMETQSKLLRVLETRNIRMVGDTAERDVNIRLIATTNRSLAEMVKVGEFRADLYYRLNVVPMALPPLRERHGDIPLLAMAFLRHFSHGMDLEPHGFLPAAMRQLEVYSWPGNVRELRNIVERLAVLYGGTRIELEHLPAEVREAKAVMSATDVPRTWEEYKNLKRQIIDDLEQRFLRAALERSANNVTHAAESVGMQRPNFHALLRHHRLKPGAPPDRPAEI